MTAHKPRFRAVVDLEHGVEGNMLRNGGTGYVIAQYATYSYRLTPSFSMQDCTLFRSQPGSTNHTTIQPCSLSWSSVVLLLRPELLLNTLLPRSPAITHRFTGLPSCLCKRRRCGAHPTFVPKSCLFFQQYEHHDAATAMRDL